MTVVFADKLRQPSFFTESATGKERKEENAVTRSRSRRSVRLDIPPGRYILSRNCFVAVPAFCFLVKYGEYGNVCSEDPVESQL